MISPFYWTQPWCFQPCSVKVSNKKHIVPWCFNFQCFKAQIWIQIPALEVINGERSEFEHYRKSAAWRIKSQSLFLWPTCSTFRWRKRRQVKNQALTYAYTGNPTGLWRSAELETSHLSCRLQSAQHASWQDKPLLWKRQITACEAEGIQVHKSINTLRSIVSACLRRASSEKWFDNKIKGI